MHLYLHVPFCARRCSYCDFAIAVRREVPSRAYVDAVLTEWESWQGHPAWDLSGAIETIYLGGGTPSLLDPVEMGRLLAGLRRRRPVVAGAEITIEANPDDVVAERAEAWRALGINRVSLGVQSFNPTVLAWMHRIHTVPDAERAFAALRAAGFENISLDLIFALPAELERNWQEDLDRALGLGPEHLSLYGLTVEARTPLARWLARGETARADDESYAGEFLLADQTLRGAGFEHYEVSNAAKPGYRSRHNSAYWRRRPFIGLGPSAHSGFGHERCWNIREWSAYQLAVREGTSVREGQESLDSDSVLLEDLYLGLRTREGVPEGAIPLATIAGWEGEGWAIRQGGKVRLTPEGWLRLDALVAAVKMAGSSPLA